MASLNRACILGSLGNDPELRSTPSGQSVCDLRVATNESYTKDGQKHESTEWHSVVCWSTLAETCAKYLKKGRQVYCEGRLQTRSWEKDGVKHYKTEIIASTVQFLGGPSKGEDAPAIPPADDGGEVPF